MSPSRWLEKKHLLCSAAWNKEDFLEKLLHPNEVLAVSDILQPIEAFSFATTPEVLKKLAVTEELLKTTIAYRG